LGHLLGLARVPHHKPLTALADFDLALDLGFLTKNRTYTFFAPKFIIYATYLSEKIGYWRYISIYRHLQANPNSQLYPIFQYFENWCQDENRHGDFFTALLKAQPQFLNNWEARLWSRFFCLSVYVTMYLNDHGRSSFYESIGLNTTQFNMHVLHQTNKTTALIFPEVIDTYNPQFKERLDKLVVLNVKLSSGKLNPLEKAGVLMGFASELLGLILMPTVKTGSVDIDPELQASYVY
jgi:magnesium-protoporphyrin IX monomethyl ester (oxidative) cyclase